MSWSWPLFVWGAGVGVVGIAGSYAIGRLARLGYDQRRAYVGLAGLSLGVASVAAVIPSATVDVLFTAFVAIANFAVPLLLLSRGTSRAADQTAAHACGADTSCSAAACATCPLVSK